MRVMIDLRASVKNISPLKEIAARQGISEKYLENIAKIAGAERLSGGLARQGQRLPAHPQPGSVHRGRIMMLTEGSARQ